MKLKQVTLIFDKQKVDFIVYHESATHALLIAKILYLEMMKSLVDEKQLYKSLFLFQKVKRFEKTMYMQVGENEENEKTKQRLYVEAINGKSSGDSV